MFYGIDVIIVAPGSVSTPIWDKAEQFDISAYADTEYIEAARRAREYMIQSGKNGLPVDKVSEVVLEALITPKPRVRYAVVRPGSITRFAQMFLPKRFIDSLIVKSLGFKRIRSTP
jgi:short-subunit dehydrogenase